MKIRNTAAALIYISVVLASCNKANSDATVRSNFAAYMAYWKNNDIRGVWSMMSPRLKRGNNYSEAAFSDYVKRQGFRYDSYNIRKIEIYGGRAKVFSDMSYVELSGKYFGSEREVCDLVMYRGRWYLDGCKPQ